VVTLWSDAHEASHGASRHFDRLNVRLAQQRIMSIGSVGMLIASHLKDIIQSTG
jgi:predicted Zn-dependent protease